MLLKASLGLHVDGIGSRVIFRKPQRPSWLDRLALSGLEVGKETVDLVAERQRQGVRVTLLRGTSVRVVQRHT